MDNSLFAQIETLGGKVYFFGECVWATQLKIKLRHYKIAILYCTPEVVIDPPLMAVVPVEAFCTTEAAVTAALKVVVPVEVSAMAANLLVPPTIPVKVSLPEPEVMVKA